MTSLVNQIDLNADTPVASLAGTRGWFGDWGGRATIFCGAVTIAHILYVFFHWGGEENASLINNLASIFFYVGPGILALRTARQQSLPRRVRYAWAFIAIADVCYLAAAILWAYFENYLGEQPFPSLADVGYLAYYPVMLVGLLFLSERIKSREELLNFVLDACIIVIGAGMVLWYFLLEPIALAGESWDTKTILSLAYPIADLVLLIGIASLLLRQSGIEGRGPINFILAAMVFSFAADFIFGYQSLIGVYHSGDPVDALYTLGCFPVMIAAHQYYLISKRNADPDAKLVDRLKHSLWAPYASIAVTYWLLLKLAIERPGAFPIWAICVPAVLTVIVVLRQYMFVRENIKANSIVGELQERIRGIYTNSKDAIGLIDFDGVLTEANDSFVSLAGFSREELLGGMKYHDLVAPEYSDNARDLAKLTADYDQPIECEKVLLRKDGIRVCVLATLFTVKGGDGKPSAIAVIIRDHTERRTFEAQLTNQALHDPLTNLANRTLFRDRVAHAIERSCRDKSRVGVLYLDLDDFKRVNDTLGHAAGDTLLIRVAERLEGCLRTSDTAARLGGDEFAVILEEGSEGDSTLLIAERIEKSFRTPFQLEGRDYYVGTSIGIATAVGGTRTSDELLRNADVAMYVAKHGGKGRHAIFEESMYDKVLYQAELENDLRNGIYRQEFEVYYQPIVNLQSGQMLGMEALVRWNHPKMGMLGPSDFMDVAEQTSLILPLGRWILDQACNDARQWQIEKNTAEELLLNVNISNRQFTDPGLVYSIEDALAMSDLPPSSLVIEIKEASLLHDPEMTASRLRELKDLGVRIAIDDFATGYSSLNYLHMFPVDILKIDRSFIANIGAGKDGGAVARAILTIGDTLHLKTIAEGVATEAQHSELKSLGCEFGQGFHFTKPLTSAEMGNFLVSLQDPDSDLHITLPPNRLLQQEDRPSIIQ